MVTETNDWKTILGWLIAEKPVLYLGDDGKWVEPDWAGSDAAYHLVTKSDGWTFRLKPHTVKIGSREVEAPLLEPVEGQRVYWTETSGTENSADFKHGELMEDRARSGRLFASEDAARAAHEAISALLRGGA